MQSFSDHNEIKLEISNRKITENFPHTWKPNNTLLNNLWAKRKSQGNFKNTLIELNENEKTTYQNLGYS